MKRYHPETGELFLPHRYEDGRYRVADPKLGTAKHHAKNQIPVSSEGALQDYVRHGYHVRMRGADSGQVNLIRPEEVVFGAAPPVSSSPVVEQPGEAPTSRTRPEAISARTARQLPRHGRIACTRCFGSADAVWGRSACEPGNGWSIINNPMAWGNTAPRILVLGFSKGGNQNADIMARPHDDVAFRGGRANLSIILETLGLKQRDRPIDQVISDQKGDFAFGSLVRCSVKKRDGEEWVMSGKAIMTACLRDREMGIVIKNCVAEFLGNLPDGLRLVVMLGNDAGYINGCFAAIREARPRLKPINIVAYADEQVVFVHTVHFKAQGPTVPDWASGVPGRAKRPETDQALKRDLAIEAVRRSGVL